MALGASIWGFLLLAYGAKWVFNKPEAMAEIRHPVQCCFVSLVPACTTLMGLVVAPYARELAVGLWIIGTVGQLGFVMFRAAGLWRGDLDINFVTPILYLPTVAANLISSIVAGALGLISWGYLFLGMGFFSWIAIESVLLMRLWIAPPLSLPLRPSLGIHMAPPVVASVAYLSNTFGKPDLFVVGMWGYGLLQLLYLVRLLPWVRQQEFSASYWGYSFGATAVTVAGIQMAIRDPHSAMALLSIPLFLFSNGVILLLLTGTLIRIVQGRLLPRPLTHTT
jgi:tellurite resistance protein